MHYGIVYFISMRGKRGDMAGYPSWATVASESGGQWGKGVIGRGVGKRSVGSN